MSSPSGDEADCQAQNECREQGLARATVNYRSFGHSRWQSFSGGRYSQSRRIAT